MEPTQDERLERIREVSDHALRYYATAYLNTDEAEVHPIADRQLLLGYMRQVANVVMLLDANELDDRSMLRGRSQVVDRYLDLARTEPWTPPDPAGAE